MNREETLDNLKKKKKFLETSIEGAEIAIQNAESKLQSVKQLKESTKYVLKVCEATMFWVEHQSDDMAPIPHAIIKAANDLAWQLEAEKQASQMIGPIDFEARSGCSSECPGWNGIKGSCACGSHMVRWIPGAGHSFKSPMIIASAAPDGLPVLKESVSDLEAMSLLAEGLFAHTKAAGLANSTEAAVLRGRANRNTIH